MANTVVELLPLLPLLSGRMMQDEAMDYYVQAQGSSTILSLSSISTRKSRGVVEFDGQAKIHVAVAEASCSGLTRHVERLCQGVIVESKGRSNKEVVLLLVGLLLGKDALDW
jgi:hypothetical protein